MKIALVFQRLLEGARLDTAQFADVFTGDVIARQPAVVIREATRREWEAQSEYCAEDDARAHLPGARFYWISTD